METLQINAIDKKGIQKRKSRAGNAFTRVRHASMNASGPNKVDEWMNPLLADAVETPAGTCQDLCFYPPEPHWPEVCPSRQISGEAFRCKSFSKRPTGHPPAVVCFGPLITFDFFSSRDGLAMP